MKGYNGCSPGIKLRCAAARRHTMGTTAIRRATPDDVDRLAPALGRAFLQDPIFTWLFPDPRRRATDAVRFFAWTLRRVSLPLGEVWCTPEREAAALWAPPNRWRLSLAAQARLLPSAMALFGARTIPIAWGFNQLEARHPQREHWYLYFIGTDPAHQRQGHGDALMRPMLERADADRLGTYLEASTAAVVPYYRRFGFEVTGEFSLRRGPTWWLMWREPGRPTSP
jgi:ribosomal protein S18 acetylase RimI-like enzyme